MPTLAEKIAAATPLAKLTANDVIEDRQEHLTGPRDLIAVPPSTTVRAAMELLHTYNITALPVYSHDRPGVIVNIVNTFDLLDYVVSFSQQHCVGREETVGAARIQQISNLKLNANIEAVMTLDSDRESYRLIEQERHDALDTLLKAFSAGGHYAIVVDQRSITDPLPPALLTQTDIVRFAARYPDCLRGLNLDAPLTTFECFNDKQAIVSVQEDQTALDAFAIMRQHNLTCVAVLNAQGELVANLRAFDAGFVAASELSILYRSVIEFLKMATNATLMPVCCSPMASVRELLNGMVRARTHYVWVVDEARRPKQVISLTDMVRWLSAASL
ncbi:hypothetical protein BDF22DRAFT_690691 [Syncephalis plumigaleata]|nr:hypothetical protein BDF22DRAFT_690691 [Syncephalis plumigaleata]